MATTVKLLSSEIDFDTISSTYETGVFSTVDALDVLDNKIDRYIRINNKNIKKQSWKHGRNRRK